MVLEVDLASRHHQIAIEDILPYYGHYEFVMISFGLTNTPIAFRKLMNEVFVNTWIST